MIKIQAHPNYINQLRIFEWSENLQVDWYNFLDYCRFSNLATILVEDIHKYRYERYRENRRKYRENIQKHKQNETDNINFNFYLLASKFKFNVSKHQ